MNGRWKGFSSSPAEIGNTPTDHVLPPSCLHISTSTQSQSESSDFKSQVANEMLFPFCMIMSYFLNFGSCQILTFSTLSLSPLTTVFLHIPTTTEHGASTQKFSSIIGSESQSPSFVGSDFRNAFPKFKRADINIFRLHFPNLVFVP